MTILKLYKNVGFNKEDNFVIENFSQYLKQFKSVSLNIQYQKITTDKEIKIILNQEFSNPLKDERFSYCSILNENEKIAYYFITSIEWKSSSCCSLHLTLDILNSFTLNEDYNLTNRTHVLREHKDRLIFKNHVIETDIASDIHSVKLLNDEMEEDVNAVDSLNTEMQQMDQTFLSYSGYFYQQLSMNVNFKNGFNKEVAVVQIKDGKLNNCLGNIDIDGKVDAPSQFVKGNLESIILNEEGNSFYVTIKNENNSQQIELLFNEGKIGLIYQMEDIEETDFATRDDFLSFLNNIDYYTEFNYDYYLNVERKIDLINENLNPVLYHGNVEEINDDAPSDWFLVYKSDESLGIKCYLVSDKNLIINSSNLAASSYAITPEMLLEGKYYFISTAKSGNVRFKDRNGKSFNFNLYQNNPSIYEIYKIGNKIHITAVSYTNHTEFTDMYSFTSDLLFIEPESIPQNKITYGIGEKPQLDVNMHYYHANGLTSFSNLEGNIWNFNKEENIALINGIDEIDRTDSTLVKIIKLPYLPCDFKLDSNNRLIVTNDFSLENGFLKLVNKNYQFKRTLNNINIYQRYLSTTVGVNIVDYPKSEVYESKLFNSEFFIPKYYYDSFNFTYLLETINIDDIPIKSVDFINYYVTSTINSRFMFEFENYYVGSMNHEDFNNYLIVTRNNELPIYNNEYINYIKNGYNYDVKARNREIVSGAVGLSAAILGSAVSAIATGGVGAVVGGAVTASSITNFVTNVINSEASLEQKKQQLRAQSASVQGSDDIDLMSIYGKNRLLFTTYKCSERVEKLIFELFYLNGYAANEYKIPNLNSRILFNFIQCDAIIEYNNNLIDSDLLNLLKEKYAKGLTFIHQFNLKWDLSFKYENLERSIYNEII